METNVILKYRRESDCWACPNCDSENSMSYGKCAVCGVERNPSAPIIKAWSPEQERLEQMAALRRPPANPAYRTDHSRPMYSAPSRSAGGSDDNGMKILWIVLAVLATLLLIIVVANV